MVIDEREKKKKDLVGGLPKNRGQKMRERRGEGSRRMASHKKEKKKRSSLGEISHP